MNKLAVLLTHGEAYCAMRSGKKRIIASSHHIRTGMEFGATLTDNNAACGYKLTAKCLNAQHLGVGIAAVFG